MGGATAGGAGCIGNANTGGRADSAGSVQDGRRAGGEEGEDEGGNGELHCGQDKLVMGRLMV